MISSEMANLAGLRAFKLIRMSFRGGSQSRDTQFGIPVLHLASGYAYIA